MRVALAIEGSNSRGMGHVFRSFLYIQYMEKHKIEFIYLINNDINTIEVLKKRKIPYIVVDYQDTFSNWEEKIIKKYEVDIWFNDKFETTVEMAKHIKKQEILFCCLDDVGKGAEEADIYFAGMIYPTLQKRIGKNYYGGSKFITLNEEINKYKKERNQIRRIIVTMGGSDPFQVTEQVLDEMKKYDYEVSFVVGPNYREKRRLEIINGGRFPIYQNIPSLIEIFSDYDLAITGGGVTCCEANASGIPCLIIANALHEINTGKWMEKQGGCVFLGDYKNWNREFLKKIPSLDIKQMSRKALDNFDTKGIERIFNIMKENWENDVRIL